FELIRGCRSAEEKSMAGNRLNTHVGTFRRYFESASRALRRWFSPPRRRPIRRARPHGSLCLDHLEDRTLLSATVAATVTNSVLSGVLTDGSTDATTVLVHRKSSDSTKADYTNLEITLNGTAQGITVNGTAGNTVALSSFTGIRLQAGAGTDTLKVDEG